MASPMFDLLNMHVNSKRRITEGIAATSCWFLHNQRLLCPESGRDLKGAAWKLGVILDEGESHYFELMNRNVKIGPSSQLLSAGKKQKVACDCSYYLA